ncbi:alpha/beta hydrolase [Psychroflexus sp. CAK8W]|uniref:Alpha/beta hydrolase n=1 Tax=Psychroflexus longus TaxID=2873596 RepID=A0ABS7XIE9_9FLAO|nr:alpha/beta hydrolase [Psychroflexus longus]MBZ9778748.1 alpha/beta hydrolase [Psychroflexus longus]
MKSFYIILISLLLPFASNAQDLSGQWTGQLKFGGTSLDLNFRIYKDEGGYKSMISSPAQNLNDLKTTSTSFVDSLLTIEINPLRAKYQGKLTATDTIAGNFVQNGMSLKLNLTRGDTKLKRPQEPLPPFDYYEEDVVFRNEKDSINLAGTLTLPKKQGQFPVVVLLSGSGPQDRNSFILGHKPFLLLADELTKSGVGVLRFDERGVGESEGRFQDAELSNFIGDVTSALDFLKTRTEVDKEKIGLLGHSIGGIIAPQVAVQEDIAFMVLLAAPAIEGDKLLLKQRADFLKLRGLNDAQIEKSNDIFVKTYEFILSTDSEDDEFKKELTDFLAANYAEVMMEKELMVMVEQLTSKETLILLKNKPSNYLSQIDCPVLAINGDKDFQVSSKENLAAIELEIKKGGNTNIETKEFEGLNHLFQESETGDSTEYGIIEQTMSPQVLEYIKEWLNRTL